MNHLLIEILKHVNVNNHNFHKDFPPYLQEFFTFYENQ